MSHEPVRTCVGCRKRASKAELLRVVAVERDHDPRVVPDPQGRAAGRGAHLHPRPECLEAAVRRRAFTRALRLTRGPATGDLAAYVEQQALSEIDEKKMEQQLMSTR